MISTSRGMVRRSVAGLALACALGSCSFDTSPFREPCIQGSTVSCTCDDRRAGTAACLARGGVGECDCEGTGSDGLAGAGGGVGGAGAGTNGPIMSGGAGGASGAGGTGAAADAGPSGDAAAAGPDAGVDTGVPPGVDSGMPPPNADLYKPCATSAECGGGLACAPIDAGMGPAGYCSELCLATTDCTQPSTGTAAAECLGGQCLLQCTFGAVCPSGMMCLLLPPFIVNGYCYY